MLVYPAAIFEMANERDREYMMGIYKKYGCVICKTLTQLIDRRSSIDMIASKSCVEMIKEIELFRKLDSDTLECCIVSILKNTYLGQITQRDSFFWDAQDFHLSIQTGFRQDGPEAPKKDLHLLKMEYIRKIVVSHRMIDMSYTGKRGLDAGGGRSALN